MKGAPRRKGRAGRGGRREAARRLSAQGATTFFRARVGPVRMDERRDLQDRSEAGEHAAKDHAPFAKMDKTQQKKGDAPDVSDHSAGGQGITG